MLQKWTWAVGWVLWCGTAPTQAALTISPVVVRVASDGRAIVTVRNERARGVMYQITVLQWFQVDGQDRYEATADFMASPPLFSLAAGASQIVRVGFRRPVRTHVEQAYRLLLAEVPRAGELAGELGQVEFAMQYDLPVFVAPTLGADPRPLLWQMRQEADTVVLRADNPSSAHVVLSQVGLVQAPDQRPAPELTSQRRSTVLAGAWREWRFPLPQGGLPRPWRMVVQRDGQAVEVVPEADVRAHGP
jgi:fimbrial chaperone protein